MLHQRRLCVIQMPDIVLGRIFGTARIKQAPHLLLDRLAIMPFRHDVILVEDMTKEMAIIELVQQLGVDIGWKLLAPSLVVAAKSDIEGHDVLHLTPVDRTVANRGASGGEAVKKRLLALGLRANEEIPAVGWKDRFQILRGFLDAIIDPSAG
jgi:hypothetical protein